MDGAPDQTGEQPRRNGGWRWLRWIILIPLLLVGLVLAALWLLDTGPGHRFLTDRIAEIAPRSGLRFQVGRIEGSIYSRAHLRDVRIYDPQGLIFSSGDILLDWQPIAWLNNKLDINELSAPAATLHKVPKLTPTGRRGPILPGFDIRIGALRIDRLTIAAPVTGKAQNASLSGRADIRNGRALVDLAAAADGGDRLKLVLDAESDRDRFDIDARMSAPGGGLFGKLIGTERPIELQVNGDGRWSAWKGTALLDMSGQRIADLALGVNQGLYSLNGTTFPARIAKGKVIRLTSPSVRISGTAQLENRRLTTDLTLRSAALTIGAKGIVDLARSALDDMRVDVRLLEPPALFPNMRGTDVALQLLFDGPFDTAQFEYLLTAPRVMFDRTGFDRIRATGKGRLSRSPINVPLRLTAARVTGVGDVAGGILANLSVDGVLRLTSKVLTGDGLRMRSDKLTSKISLFVDLVTGRYDIGLTGQLTRYLIPGLGIVDVRTSLNVVPGPNGRGTRVAGRGQAWVRRFDNAFLASLAGGLPQIETRLERGPDGILHLNGLRLVGPEIDLTGNGYRRHDGTFYFEGGGKQATYGPVKLTLDGQIDRPKLDLFLPSPMDALGLADVHLLLDPTVAGFDYRAEGGSTLGPFASNGAILLPRGQQARIQVAVLDVTGTHATGELVPMPGGFDGALAVNGGGMTGNIGFDRLGELQRVSVKLDMRRARLAGMPNLSVGRGQVDGQLVLDPAGMTMKGTVMGRGMRRGGMSLARLNADTDLSRGSGQVRATFAGSRGRAFDLQTVATIGSDSISLAGEGTIDRRPIKLTTPAVVTHDGAGWRVAPTALSFAGGSAKVAGRFGKGPDELDTTVERMPLTIMDIFYPGLGLGGSASGRLSYRDPPGALPSGEADIVIRGLTRSGLVLSSRPIDVGVKAALTPTSAAARAIVASNNRTIGRAQMRLSPLAAEGGLMTRLSEAPLFAQLRYDGPADTLWRLTGVEIFDLSGPVAVGADMSGRLSDPQIRGSVRTENARLESAVTGTVLTQMKATGRFGGSRLVIDDFSARAGEGGTVSGRGRFDLASARGFGMDLALQAENAVLLNRDDIGATVTGPLTIRSDGAGGEIAGEVVLNRSRYQMGRATAQAAVPRLNVTEINARGGDEDVDEPPVPWRLALKAVARNRLTVTGLGLDSEWRANLDIGGTVTEPAVAGQADLLRGDYDFAGRSFELDRGTIRFDGSSPPNPTLDIAASASLQGLNATIRVTGSGLKPEISFLSTPALPEDELLSRLLFGTSITNLSAPEALQLASAVAGLQSGGGLDPINAVRQAAGLDRLRILPADPTLGQGTSLAAGKYVTRRTYVEVITDGQGYSATRVEFQITRWLSLLSSISTLGRQSANVRVSRDY